MALVAINGNTYPIKDQLRALGGKWDAANKVWMVPQERASEAQKLVDTVPAKSRSKSSSSYRANWSPCGYPGCNPNHCDECDGRGAYRSYRSW